MYLHIGGGVTQDWISREELSHVDTSKINEQKRPAVNHDGPLCFKQALPLNDHHSKNYQEIIIT